jgi:hypothetical protein
MKIKKIPWLVNIVFFRKPKGLAFRNTIYLSRYYYKMKLDGNLSVELEALITHETTHADRFKDNWCINTFRYYLSPQFRLLEEIVATTAEIEIYRKRGGKFDCAGRAHSWSSINYLFMTSYEEAYRILSSV